MPTFEFTSPEGKKYRITGPEGATSEQAFQQLQQNLPKPTSKPAVREPGFVEGVSTTLGNVPGSAKKLVGDYYQAFSHPIDTLFAMRALGKGVMQKVGVWPGNDALPYADEVGRMVMERYGSTDAAIKTLQTDPVGMLADMAGLFSGGGMAARAPGMAGRIAGRIATIDPVRIAGSALQLPDKAAWILQNPRIAKQVGRVAGATAGHAAGGGVGGTLVGAVVGGAATPIVQAAGRTAERVTGPIAAAGRLVADIAPTPVTTAALQGGRLPEPPVYDPAIQNRIDESFKDLTPSRSVFSSLKDAVTTPRDVATGRLRVNVGLPQEYMGPD